MRTGWPAAGKLGSVRHECRPAEDFGHFVSEKRHQLAPALRRALQRRQDAGPAAPGRGRTEPVRPDARRRARQQTARVQEPLRLGRQGNLRAGGVVDPTTYSISSSRSTRKGIPFHEGIEQFAPYAANISAFHDLSFADKAVFHYEDFASEETGTFAFWRFSAWILIERRAISERLSKPPALGTRAMGCLGSAPGAERRSAGHNPQIASPPLGASYENLSRSVFEGRRVAASTPRTPTIQRSRGRMRR